MNTMSQKRVIQSKSALKWKILNSKARSSVARQFHRFYHLPFGLQRQRIPRLLSSPWRPFYGGSYSSPPVLPPQTLPRTRYCIPGCMRPKRELSSHSRRKTKRGYQLLHGDLEFNYRNETKGSNFEMFARLKWLRLMCVILVVLYNDRNNALQISSRGLKRQCEQCWK